MVCFASKAVVRESTTAAAERVLSRAGLGPRSLRCNVLQLRGATARLDCLGYAYVGRYAGALTFDSGANANPKLSGTHMFVSLGRVIRWR